MKRLINKINAWIHSKRIIFNDMGCSPIVPTVQEDIRDMETRKRVAKAFEEQAEQISMRAKKQHSCLDPIQCRKRVCYRFTPDKVVSKKVVTKKDIDNDFGR